MEKDPTKPPSLLRISEVLRRTGLKRSTLYRELNLKRFPPSITLVGRTKVWPENVVDDWIREKIKAGIKANETVGSLEVTFKEDVARKLREKEPE